MLYHDCVGKGTHQPCIYRKGHHHWRSSTRSQLHCNRCISMLLMLLWLSLGLPLFQKSHIFFRCILGTIISSILNSCTILGRDQCQVWEGMTNDKEITCIAHAFKSTFQCNFKLSVYGITVTAFEWRWCRHWDTFTFCSEIACDGFMVGSMMRSGRHIPHQFLSKRSFNFTIYHKWNPLRHELLKALTVKYALFTSRAVFFARCLTNWHHAMP